MSVSQSSEKTLDQRARHAAQRIGFQARKSRWRLNSIDNLGEFMLVESNPNCIVGGEKFAMRAVEVVARCAARSN